MKIVEGLKKLRVLEKRINVNTQAISKYASKVSTERATFETDKAQEEAVASLIQSNLDLVAEMMALKGRIERTNLTVMARLESNGKEYTLSQLLMLRRGKLAKLLEGTYTALNDSAGRSRLQGAHGLTDEHGKAPQVIRFYKEQDRLDGIRVWQDVYAEIDGRLEVINATQDLVD